MLKDRVVVVTGSAQGIGLAIARKFAEHQARVVINDINPAELETGDESLKDLGGSSLRIVADISRKEGVDRLVREVKENLGDIDIWVNNAGYLLCKNFLEYTEEDWDHSFAVNLRSMFLCCRDRKSVV